MADFSKINLYGETLNVKDSTARTAASNAGTSASSALTAANEAKTTASTANQKADKNATDIATLKGSSINIAYSEDDETISFTKGV